MTGEQPGAATWILEAQAMDGARPSGEARLPVATKGAAATVMHAGAGVATRVAVVEVRW